MDWKEAELLFLHGSHRKLELFSSANNLVNTIYALRQQGFKNDPIIDLLELTLENLQLVDTSKPAFLRALRGSFNDLEDAVQYYAALEIKGIHYFITSNLKDYKSALQILPVLTPKQFLRIFHQK